MPRYKYREDGSVDLTHPINPGDPDYDNAPCEMAYIFSSEEAQKQAYYLGVPTVK